MDVAEAQLIIESLRIGIPPTQYINEFTVGRKNEIKKLKSRLQSGKPGQLLLKANYGSGKTHLLKFIGENALNSQYLVSYIALDSKEKVRFNRLDQIVGAIWRGLQVPSQRNLKGVGPFMDFVCKTIEENELGKNDFFKKLTNNWEWDYSNVLESPSMFIAIRAWTTGDKDAQSLIQDWFYQPENYEKQRKLLYNNLILKFRDSFRDPRPEFRFYDYKTGIFNFRLQDYQQSWAMLRDIDILAKQCGFKGFIILFDEFEDVLSNLNNITYQEDAFWNLFQFFSGKEFSGGAFFAVTPEFVQKCKNLLMRKTRFDYDFSWFDALPTFSMSPLEPQELEDLALKIMRVHGIAFEWDPNSKVNNSELKRLVTRIASVQVPDRTRQTIKEVVKFLDSRLQECQ